MSNPDKPTFKTLDGFVQYLAFGWGYGLSVASRLLFFNFFLFVPAIKSVEASSGHSLSLAASIIASACLTIWSLGRVGDEKSAHFLGLVASALLATASVCLAVGRGATILWAYALGGAGLVVINALWETALSRRGIRAAFAARLGGTLLGSALFLMSFMLPPVVGTASCAVLPIASGIAFSIWKSPASESHKADTEQQPGPQQGILKAIQAAPCGVFATVALSYVAFGTIRMSVTSEQATSTFVSIPALLPTITLIAVAVAVTAVLRLRRLDISRIVEIAAPLIAISVALPVFDAPLSSGVFSYLLVYAGCEVLFLFAWVPIISAVHEKRCEALFCFSLLGLFQWAGSLAGNAIYFFASSYDQAAALVLLALMACLLVTLRQSNPKSTITIADASTSTAVPGRMLSIQDRCDALGTRYGLSNREIEALIINFIRTPPTFIRTCADECGKCSGEVDNQGSQISYLRGAATGCYSIRVLSILGVLSPF